MALSYLTIEVNAWTFAIFNKDNTCLLEGLPNYG